jgi:hypothetical protein
VSRTWQGCDLIANGRQHPWQGWRSAKPVTLPSSETDNRAKSNLSGAPVTPEGPSPAPGERRWCPDPERRELCFAAFLAPLLGPWRWMVVVYHYDEALDQVAIVTIPDARSARSPRQ